MDLSKLSVMIVDDSRSMRTLLANILSSLGVREVTEMGDPAGALQEMRHAMPDILLVDWRMDLIDGIEFTRLVRTGADSPNPYIPIIMVTGHTERNNVVAAREAGVTEFVAKPVSVKALAARLSAVVDKPRPFVKSKGYFGPDRRRRFNPDYDGPRRRESDKSGAASEKAAAG